VIIVSVREEKAVRPYPRRAKRSTPFVLDKAEQNFCPIPLPSRVIVLVTDGVVEQRRKRRHHAVLKHKGEALLSPRGKARPP
jgi:hypothetical protein